MNEKSPNIRILRLQKRFQQSLQEMLVRGDVDTSLKYIHICNIQLSKDLSHLKAYYELGVCCDQPADFYQTKLDESVAFIQKMLKKKQFRRLPKIRFISQKKNVFL